MHEDTVNHLGGGQYTLVLPGSLLLALCQPHPRLTLRNEGRRYMSPLHSLGKDNQIFFSLVYYRFLHCWIIVRFLTTKSMENLSASINWWSITIFYTNQINATIVLRWLRFLFLTEEASQKIAAEQLFLFARLNAHIPKSQIWSMPPLHIKSRSVNDRLEWADRRILPRLR